MKKYFSLILKFVVSFAILAFLFFKIDINNIFAVLRNADVKLLIAAFIIMIACWIVNSIKWQLILNRLEEKILLGDLVKLNFLSLFYSVFMPGGQITGELFKFYKLAKNNENRSTLAISVFMDKLSGLIAAILVGLIGLLLSASNIINYNGIVIIFLLFTAFSTLIALFFSRRLFNVLGSYLKYLQPIKYLSGIHNLMAIFEKFIGAYKFLTITLFYGAIFQLLNVFYIYLLAVSLGINVSYLDLIWVTSLASIILIIPVTIMGLGLREASLIYLLGLVGIASSRAFSLSILIFVLSLSAGLGGMIFEYVNLIFFKYVKKNN